LHDLRLHVRLGEFADLLGRASAYDVILSQPAGVWSARAARVSTREFLELARERLAPGGLYCQWLPDSALTKTGFMTLLGTFTAVFPHVELWAGSAGDILLLARRERARHDVENILAAYGRPETAGSLRETWLEDPLVLLSQFLAGDESVRRLAAGMPVGDTGNSQLLRRETARRWQESTVNPVPGLAAIRDDVLAVLTNAPEEGFAAAVRRTVEARDLEWRGIELESHGSEGSEFDAVAAYEQGLERSPRDGSLRRALAMLRTRMGIRYANRQQTIAGHAALRTAVETDTTFAAGFANLAQFNVMAGNLEYAIACLDEAVTLEPDSDLHHLGLANVWRRRGYYDEALPLYERALALNPRNVEAALAYVETKLSAERAPDLPWALEYLRGYLEYEPDHEDLLSLMARLEDAIRGGPAAREEPAEPAAAQTPHEH